jgi:hypothetical protein
MKLRVRPSVLIFGHILGSYLALLWMILIAARLGYHVVGSGMLLAGLLAPIMFPIILASNLLRRFPGDIRAWELACMCAAYALGYLLVRRALRRKKTPEIST